MEDILLPVMPGAMLVIKSQQAVLLPARCPGMRRSEEVLDDNHDSEPATPHGTGST